jgi:hypothetical protein
MIERDEKTTAFSDKIRIFFVKSDVKIENLGNFLLKFLGIFVYLHSQIEIRCITKDL